MTVSMNDRVAFDSSHIYIKPKNEFDEAVHLEIGHHNVLVSFFMRLMGKEVSLKIRDTNNTVLHSFSITKESARQALGLNDEGNSTDDLSASEIQQNLNAMVHGIVHNYDSESVTPQPDRLQKFGFASTGHPMSPTHPDFIARNMSTKIHWTQDITPEEAVFIRAFRLTREQVRDSQQHKVRYTRPDPTGLYDPTQHHLETQEKKQQAQHIYQILSSPSCSQKEILYLAYTINMNESMLSDPKHPIDASFQTNVNILLSILQNPSREGAKRATFSKNFKELLNNVVPPYRRQLFTLLEWKYEQSRSQHWYTQSLFRMKPETGDLLHDALSLEEAQHFAPHLSKRFSI